MDLSDPWSLCTCSYLPSSGIIFSEMLAGLTFPYVWHEAYPLSKVPDVEHAPTVSFVTTLQDTVEPAQDHPLVIKMWCLETGDLCWQVYLLWNVGPARNRWSLKTGGLSWQWSFKTGVTVQTHFQQFNALELNLSFNFAHVFCFKQALACKSNSCRQVTCSDNILELIEICRSAIFAYIEILLYINLDKIHILQTSQKHTGSLYRNDAI